MMCRRSTLLRFRCSRAAGRVALLLQLPYFANPQETAAVRGQGSSARRGGAVPGSIHTAAVWPLHHSFTRRARRSFMISQLYFRILLLQVMCLRSVCHPSASRSSFRWGKSCAWPFLLWMLPTSLSTRRLWWSTLLPAFQVQPVPWFSKIALFKSNALMF